MLQRYKSVVSLKNMLSSDLALRESVNILFDKIETLNCKKIEVDFREIRSITRSFAHQYVIRKKQSKKMIINKNVPLTIKKMFDVVNRSEQQLTSVVRTKVRPLKVNLDMFLT